MSAYKEMSLTAATFQVLANLDGKWELELGRCFRQCRACLVDLSTWVQSQNHPEESLTREGALVM